MNSSTSKKRRPTAAPPSRMGRPKVAGGAALMVSMRLPRKVVAKLRAYAKAKGLSQADAVIMGLVKLGVVGADDVG